MDPSTTSDCSTVSNSSSVSMQEAPPSTPFHLLEMSLISAQDLTPVNKSMRTYAVAWTNTNPSRRLHTRTDPDGHTHPTWNEKLTFRVSPDFLLSDSSSLNIDIFTTSWFREVLVGTVTVLVADLLAPSSSSSSGHDDVIDDVIDDNKPYQPRRSRIRFVTLQVRRPSGSPQGILNMGVALLDSSMKSMQLDLHLDNKDDDDESENKKKKKKIGHLWRSLSVGSDGPGGSMVNGSELCSDIGPSASIVAADLARKCQLAPPPPPVVVRRGTTTYNKEETGSSIIGEMTMEEAKAKGYRMRSRRWREDENGSEMSSSDCGAGRHSRRKSDSGLFTCFGTAYGIEFRIVCGTPANNNKRLMANANSVSTSRKNSKAAATHATDSDAPHD